LSLIPDPYAEPGEPDIVRQTYLYLRRSLTPPEDESIHLNHYVFHEHEKPLFRHGFPR